MEGEEHSERGDEQPFGEQAQDLAADGPQAHERRQGRGGGLRRFQFLDPCSHRRRV